MLSHFLHLPKVTVNLTTLIAFTFTPSPKQNVLLDVAVSTNFVNMQSSKLTLPSLSYTRLDIFTLELFINVW